MRSAEDRNGAEMKIRGRPVLILGVKSAFGLWHRTSMLGPLGCPFWAPGRHGGGGANIQHPLNICTRSPNEAKQKEKGQN